eukprot:4661615-Amphidinium_carterae.2
MAALPLLKQSCNLRCALETCQDPTLNNAAACADGFWFGAAHSALRITASCAVRMLFFIGQERTFNIMDVLLVVLG